MANTSPIKYSDLIQPDNSIQDLISQLEEAIATYGELRQAIQSDAAAAAKAMQGLSGATDEQRQSIEQTAKEAEGLAEQMRVVRDAEIKATNDLNVAKAANKEYNQLLKLQAELTRSAEGSYNQLSAQYRIVKIRLNEMSKAQREGTEEGRKLVAQSKALYTEMSRLQKETGKYTLEVGHYENALKAIPGPLGKVIGLGQQWRGSMAQTKEAVSGLAGSLGMSTGGLMAVLGGVALAVGGVVGAFKLWTSTAHETQTAGDALDFAMAELNATITVVKKSISTWDFSGFINQLRNATTSAREVKEALDDAFERKQSIRIQRAQQAEENSILLENLRNQKLSLEERAAAGRKYLENVRPIYEQEEQLAQELYIKQRDNLFDLTNKRKFASKAEEDAARISFAAGLDEFNLNYEKIKQAREYLKSVDDLQAAQEMYSKTEGRAAELYRKQIDQNRDIVANTDESVKKMAEFVKQHGITSNEELTAYYNSREEMLWAASAYRDETRRITQQVNAIEKRQTTDTTNNAKARTNAIEDEQKAREKAAEEEEKNIQRLMDAEKKRRENLEKAEADAWTNQLKLELHVIELEIAAAEDGTDRMLNLRLARIWKQKEIEIDANRRAAKEMQVDEALIIAKYDKMRRDEIEKSAKSGVDAAKKATKQYGSVLDILLGFGNEDDPEGQRNLEKIKSNIQTVVSSIADSLSSLISSWEKSADAAVESANKQVESAQKIVDAEREAASQGYANNLKRAERELALAKKQQQEAMKEQEKAQKAQLALDSVTQAASLVTASANIWAAFSPIPYVGPALAVAALALMWGSFAASKIKAAQVTKAETYGEGTVELLEGGSHASGHDISLGRKANGVERRAEGGEYFAVINKRSSRRYRDVIPDVINSLNDGTFADKYQRANSAMAGVAVQMLGGADLTRIEKGVDAIREQGEERRTYEGGYVILRYKNLTRKIKS